MNKTFIIAEIGINHNGCIKTAEKLIEESVKAGCDAVKFQKRTIDLVYSPTFLNSFRESPWGTTQREQKEGLEFNENEYIIIDKICKNFGIQWFASSWDINSQQFLRKFDLKYNKIASAMLTNHELLETISEEGRKTFISTGMSTLNEIDDAVEIFEKHNCPYELMHCNSTYPLKEIDANISIIDCLRDRYGCDVGYSGHELNNLVSICAVSRGATSIERHITLDRNMYGSDQKSSINPIEFRNMVDYIRRIEKILGNGKKIVSKSELNTKNKLRSNS